MLILNVQDSPQINDTSKWLDRQNIEGLPLWACKRAIIMGKVFLESKQPQQSEQELCDQFGTKLYRQVSTVRVLFQLVYSKHKFYLTGSRYFGGYDDNSDWDFFTGKESINALTQMGFVTNTTTPYKDSDNLEVLTCTPRHMAWKLASLPIHIQISSDPKRKHDIQTIMRHINICPKKNDYQLWDLCFGCYECGETSK